MIGNLVRINQAKLNEMIRNPENLTNLLYSDELDVLDLDQYWHAIHFLLTGNNRETIGIFANVILGGNPLGSEEDGWEFGPPVYKTVEEVKIVSQEFNHLSLEEIAHRYNLDSFMENDIFPGCWGEDELDHLMSYIKEIKEFYETAAENSEAVIFWID